MDGNSRPAQGRAAHWAAASLGSLTSPRPPLFRRKPADLVFGVEDIPPLQIGVVSGLQHVANLAMFMIYPLLIVQQAGLGPGVGANVLSLSVVALGIGTLLQALPRGPVGCGFLSPATFTAISLGPALAAARAGGPALVFGMTIFSGVVETVLTPVLRRLRSLLPPEIGGVVIFFVGTNVATLGFRHILGSGSDAPLGFGHWSVVGVTLCVTIALNVWGKGQARMFCALIGMVAGYLTAMATGVLGANEFATFAALPVVAVPSLAHLSWTFSPAMALPFAIGAVAAATKTVGSVAVCQRLNDAEWVRPDMASISRGVLADGIGTIFAGCLGALPVNPSSSGVGLVVATGVASRVIGYIVGFMLIALAFFPQATGLLLLMPEGVMGASLLFAAAFMLISGIQTITSRMLDTRRSIVIGLAISCGIVADGIPDFAAGVPELIRPLFSSSLVLGTIVALVLNAVFRIGQRKTVMLALDPASPTAAREVDEFFAKNGKSWGARPDVIARAAFGIHQSVEAIAECCEPSPPIALAAHFDEFNLDVQVTYRGLALELPDRRPTEEEIIESETGHLLLAGYLLRRNADRVRVSAKEGTTVLDFHYEH